MRPGARARESFQHRKECSHCAMQLKEKKKKIKKRVIVLVGQAIFVGKVSCYFINLAKITLK